jgi:hypothetical protein
MSSAAKVLCKFSDNMINIITSQSEELQRRQEHAPGGVLTQLGQHSCSDQALSRGCYSLATRPSIRRLPHCETLLQTRGAGSAGRLPLCQLGLSPPLEE